MLAAIAPSPVVTMNRAVAVAMADGPEAGTRRAATPLGRPSPGPYHRLHAVRAHLLERRGDLAGAGREYARAAELTSSRPEQRYLALRLARSG